MATASYWEEGMTDQSTPALQLRAAGTAGPGEDWWEDFFPGDLPVEWQLEYYAHYHGRLLLPAAVWTETDAPVFGDWGEAVPQTLRLTLEWPAALAAEAAAERARALAASVGESPEAVLVGPAGPAQVQAVRAALAEVGLGGLPVCGPGAQRVLEPAGSAWFYAAPTESGLGGVWWLAPEVDLDARDWRRRIEALMQSGGTGETPVFLRTRPERLADVRTIARLLGVG